MINARQQQLLDHYHNVTTWVQPEYVWFGLSTSTPDTDAGTGITAPTDANYARVRMRQADLWSSASAADDGDAWAQNMLNIDFPAADSNYGTPVTYLIEWSHVSATTAVYVRRIWALSASASPQAGEVLRIPVCALKTYIGENQASVDTTLQDVTAVVT